ncbi:hypothetical protein AVEN_30574-1 [Araneus ventricosus]|uniref:Uncharacterized protein n=1 Tax=Araneus ventricosus TaxID=182803 RepID=A0A4Y2EQF2_ARAVE|nr:hypothetical protein AVEN_30574-1 [Araneus ventricosus]
MAIQNSNLPPSFVNEVVKIVEDETIVRNNLKSVSDVYSWIEEYGRTSFTKWNLQYFKPSGTRLVCCLITDQRWCFTEGTQAFARTAFPPSIHRSLEKLKNEWSGNAESRCAASDRRQPRNPEETPTKCIGTVAG